MGQASLLLSFKLRVGIENQVQGENNQGNENEIERKLGKKHGDKGEQGHDFEQLGAQLVRFVPNLVGGQGPGSPDADKVVSLGFFQKNGHEIEESGESRHQNKGHAKGRPHVPQKSQSVNVKEENRKPNHEQIIFFLKLLDILLQRVYLGNEQKEQGYYQYQNREEKQAHPLGNITIDQSLFVPMRGHPVGHQRIRKNAHQKSDNDDRKNNYFFIHVALNLILILPTFGCILPH